ncbi:alpha/beta hydrolase [Hymenobacter sp. BRD128]|uniref:alpha/beta hydrolase n=1 Tax=Hymenobacter sp. BRD128 TaxID=2675878 RepID=UPI0015644ECA|nr:alpha/beta hydrolase [Hymenobacter sp. BRD128]QKG56135.1 alpha/beta hydrolase [Hymenobacter sp. BRD128]
MHKNLLCLSLVAALSGSPCFAQLAALPDKTPAQVQAAYTVTKDVAYGTDKEQALDIYLSPTAKSLKKENYTIVFLHGGGYYVSDKSREERYIQPYLKKGLNVVNMNYRIKRGVPIATEDLTYALNFLRANNSTYHLNLDRVIVTGFSAGAHIASLVAVTANDPAYSPKLASGIKIAGVINFSGPVDGLDVVEKVFTSNDVPVMHAIGVALFPETTEYAPKEYIRKFEPITYFDKNDPPFFIWQGGKDDQVPPVTFEKFVALLQQEPQKNEVLFVPEGQHSPNANELADAYQAIFNFLDKKIK